MPSDNPLGRRLRLLPVHLVNGCLELVLDRPPLELEGCSDKTRVRHPDLGAKLDLCWNLELLQSILFSMDRQNL